MDTDFIRTRIDQLRLQQGISERGLSLALGHGASYIFDIRTGRTLPSWNEFFYICEYFHLSPQDFFQAELELSSEKRQAQELMINVKDSDMKTILAILEKFTET